MHPHEDPGWQGSDRGWDEGRHWDEDPHWDDVGIWRRERISLLIGIPLGLIVGLAVAFFLVVGSGRDTPTISTSSPPAATSTQAKPGLGQGAPQPSSQRR
jgi:hypothetical protein